ncbi:MAG: septum formation inhibitor Maf [Proteobacteria bacterium]|nr:MAG: septum formation inhibitor Maf [Pseudomonadota bacterium]
MSKGQQQTLCLASASPRRRELLAQLGFQVQVQAVTLDESRQAREKPLDYCVRLALQKNHLAVATYQPSLPVVSADTIVVLSEQTLGKPKDRAAVLATLQRLSGTEHQVITAVAVHHQGQVLHDSQISQVRFAPIDERWLSAYADSEEPYDKAGAYGIQGSAGRWIESITGSYSGIMGLPLFETARLLTKLDIMSYD